MRSKASIKNTSKTKSYTFKNNFSFNQFFIYPLAFVFVIIFTLLVYPTSSQKTAINQSQYKSTPSPTETPFVAKPPKITGWHVYTDKSNRDFSFEYPSFMAEPKQYWVDNPIRFDSNVSWFKEKHESGTVIHGITLTITGPEPKSDQASLIEWLRRYNQKFDEGTFETMGGYDTVKFISLHGRQVVQKVGIINPDKYPSYQSLSFKTRHGVYEIFLHIQAPEDEVALYQNLWPHILSTLKFSD